MSDSWAVDAYAKHRDQLLQCTIFDDLAQEVQALADQSNFERELGRFTCTTSSFCGASFKKGQLLYHCSTCALDETCVLCETCFDYETHKDHNYWYTISSESNGSCDCGEEDSWKGDLGCPLHRPPSTEASLQEQVVLDAPVVELFERMSNWMIDAVRAFARPSSLADSDPKVIVLYNDEQHSFDEVIEKLSVELHIDTAKAEAYAKLVDEKGFAAVYSSPSANVCERLARKLGSTGLSVSVEGHDTCFQMILGTVLLDFMKEALCEFPPLRAGMVSWMLDRPTDNGPLELRGRDAVEAGSNLEVLLLCDHVLWKSFRKNMHEILNLCNSIDLSLKKKIAQCFCRQYDTVFDAYLKEKREPQLSIVSFSVQLFTLTPTAEFCVRETPILETIFNKIVSILEPGFQPKIGLKLQSIRNFDYGKFSMLLHDALHLLRNIKDKRHEAVLQPAVVEAFVYALFLLTHIDCHVRKTDRHVVYERDNFDHANYVCYEMLKIGQEFVKFLVNMPDLSTVWSTMEKYVGQSELFSSYLRDDYASEPLYKSRRRVSYFGTLTWFWAALLQELVAQDKLQQAHPPLRLVRRFATDSLVRLMFSAEVRSGLWVRNGMILMQQEYFYAETTFVHLTYLADVFNCCVSGQLMERSCYFNFLVKCSGLFGYFEEYDQNAGAIEQALVLLLHGLVAQPRTLDQDQMVINLLCAESASRNSLVRRLPECIADDDGFRARVLRLASLNFISTLGADAKLELRTEYASRFDPFYWAFPMDIRMRAWVRMGELGRFNFASYAAAFKENYRLVPEAPIAIDTLVDILGRLSQAGSAKIEFALAVVLFSMTAILDASQSNHGLETISGSLERLLQSPGVGSSPSIANLIRGFQSTVGLVSGSESVEGESRKLSAKDRRAGLMAQFKKQRTHYLSDGSVAGQQDSRNETGFTCVVCSEGRRDDRADADDAFGVPVQMNASFILRYSPGAESRAGRFLKGCCHMFHRDCFMALPGATFKKCPLCGGAMDQLIPVTSVDSALGCKVSPITLGRGLDSLEACESTLLGRELASPRTWESALLDSLQVPSVGDDVKGFEALLDGFCYTTLAVTLPDGPIEMLSSQLVNTLNMVKRHLFLRFFRLDALLANLQSLLSDASEETRVEVDWLLDVKTVVMLVFLLQRGVIDDSGLEAVMSAMTARQMAIRFPWPVDETQLALYLRKTGHIFNFLLGVLDSGVPSREDLVVLDRAQLDTMMTQYVTAERRRRWQAMPHRSLDFECDFELVSLPLRFDLTLRKYLRQRCDSCQSVPRSPAVCLVCGTLVCVGDRCCRRVYGECTLHRQTCSGSTGMFLLVKNAALLLLSESSGTVVPAPYMNCFGEHDMDLRADFALHLHVESYRSKIQSLWLNNEIRDYILRNMNETRLAAESWLML